MIYSSSRNKLRIYNNAEVDQHCECLQNRKMAMWKKVVIFAKLISAGYTIKTGCKLITSLLKCNKTSLIQ